MHQNIVLKLTSKRYSKTHIKTYITGQIVSLDLSRVSPMSWPMELNGLTLRLRPRQG